MKLITRRNTAFIYEVSLPLMALFSFFTLIALGSSYFHPGRQPLAIYAADHIIWAIFTADFFIRLCFACDLRRFLKSHICELVAIIPVVPFIMINYIFEILKWDTLSSILIQAVFFIKFLAYMGRAFATQSRFFKTNLLHYAGGITLVAIVVSAIVFAGAEHSTYADAIWWAFVTVSTTGYGDIVPHSATGRVVGVFLMVVGVACITSFTSILAGKIMSRGYGDKLSNPHLAVVARQLARFQELSDGDVDDICAVLKSLKRGGPQKKPEEKQMPGRPAYCDKWGGYRLVRWVRVKFSFLMKEDERLASRAEDGGNTE